MVRFFFLEFLNDKCSKLDIALDRKYKSFSHAFRFKQPYVTIEQCKTDMGLESGADLRQVTVVGVIMLTAG